MNLGGGYVGKGDDEKSPESPGRHHLRRLHHRLTINNLSPKSITWIMLLVVFLDLFCLLLYQSITKNQILATSQGPKHSFPPQDSSFMRANIFSPSDDEPNTEGNLPSPSFEPQHDYTASSAASVRGNLSFPAESVQGNLSSPVSSPF
ncbi:hypothetical protein ACH5RR_039135 [Cinchona calisaya]|uniref:Uncharacterized protein n=1 Tax=Cinchona calisaya TaxID=153742 RepID=A0ABD2Y2J8_9GENT